MMGMAHIKALQPESKSRYDDVGVTSYLNEDKPCHSQPTCIFKSNYTGEEACWSVNGNYLYEFTDICTLCMEGINYVKPQGIQIIESLQVFYDL